MITTTSIINTYKTYINSVFIPIYLSAITQNMQGVSKCGRVSYSAWETIAREIFEDFKNENPHTDGYYIEAKSAMVGEKFKYRYGCDWHHKLRDEKTKTHVLISY